MFYRMLCYALYVYSTTSNDLPERGGAGKKKGDPFGSPSLSGSSATSLGTQQSLGRALPKPYAVH